MSDEVAEKKSSVNKKGSYRKRRPQNRRATEQHAADGDNKTEIVVKREKVEMVPVPEELIGKPAEGTVVSVIRKGKYNFGFISLTTGDDFDDKTLPRIYFNPSCLVDSTVYLRCGYTVKFICGNDDVGRSVAKEIELIEEGKKVQMEREAIIPLKRSEKQLQQDQQQEKDSAGTTSHKRRDSCKAKEYKNVSLKIQKEGMSKIPSDISFQISADFIPSDIISQYSALVPSLGSVCASLQVTVKKNVETMQQVHGNSNYRKEIVFQRSNLTQEEFDEKLKDKESNLSYSWGIRKQILGMFDDTAKLTEDIVVYRNCAYFKQHNPNEIAIDNEFFVPPSASVSQDYMNKYTGYFTFTVCAGAKVLPTLPYLCGKVGIKEEMEVLLPSIEHANYELIEGRRYLVTARY